MAHRPGSFTKNFGWETEERSLVKLYAAARAGFGGRLEPVERSTWRAQAGLPDADRELVVLNFFLHNHLHGTMNMVSVDELVFQAVQSAHTRAFDHLALYALNLSEAGQRAGHNNGEAHPILWANEFVREELWRQDAWHAEALNQASVRQTIAGRIDALPDTIAKCISNYRRIFTLCGYNVGGTGPLNSAAESIAPAAYFLTWDRLTLDGVLTNAATVEDFIAVLKDREVHKLLGTGWSFLEDTARQTALDYLTVGGQSRLLSVRIAASPELSTLTQINLKQLVDQMKSDTTVERKKRLIAQQVRDRNLAACLKAAYENKCMFCGEGLTVSVDPEHHYSEVAHIKPLGTPHDGPDTLGNMLVLCPNHHLQFDCGVIRLRRDEMRFVIMHKLVGHSLSGKQLVLAGGHDLDAECVGYHYHWHDTE